MSFCLKAQLIAGQRVFVYFDGRRRSGLAFFALDSRLTLGTLLPLGSDRADGEDEVQGYAGLGLVGNDLCVAAGGDSADEIAEYLMISVRGLVYNWCTKGGAYNLTAATRRFAVRLLKAYQPT